MSNSTSSHAHSSASSVTSGLPTVTLRLRMGSHDAHYAGGLVDGAKMLQLFGDVATELLIRLDGDEGLFRAYESVEFLQPVGAGDYIEAHGRISAIGRTSRTMEFEAYKVIRPLLAKNGEAAVSAAEVLDPPLLVCRAKGTCVTPLALQRKKAPDGNSATESNSG